MKKISIKVGIIDDDETKRTQIVSYLRDCVDEFPEDLIDQYRKYQLVPVEINIHPDMNVVIDDIIEKEIDVLLIDYQLSSYDSHVNYTGVGVANGDRKNAYEAYELMTKLDPYSVKDLLKAHKIMMAGLVKEAGMFRSKGVGVYAGDQLIHAGTPANYVPDLIGQLFDWLKKSKLHPLVKSCIFHYEFEFIHPFADGNGRTGRLWHTLILAKWQEFFLWIPIESIIHERQDGYYKALNASNTSGESTIFVEFMLELIRDLLKELASGRAFTKVKTTEEKVLDLIREGEKLSAAKMAERLGLSQRQVQRILKQLKDDGVIEYVGANRNGQYKIII